MLDPFHVFQLPLIFDIDLTHLDERFRRLQLICHPDRAQSTADKALREKKSAEITQAYRILKCPVKRAYSLLEVMGIAIGKEKAVETEFLLAMMEFQEGVMEGKLTPEDIAIHLQQTLKNLSQAFQERAYDQVKIYLQKYQYLRKIGTSTHALTTS